MHFKFATTPVTCTTSALSQFFLRKRVISFVRKKKKIGIVEAKGRLGRPIDKLEVETKLTFDHNIKIITILDNKVFVTLEFSIMELHR